MVSPVFTVSWMCHVYGGHYYLVLIDLHTDAPETPTKLIRKDFPATHEFIVFEMDPEKSMFYPTGQMTLAQSRTFLPCIMLPSDHCYQFIARNDAEALARIERIVEMVNRNELDPRYTASAKWNELFPDAVSAWSTRNADQKT